MRNDLRPIARAGFTAIEMMVVVSIIIVLVAMVVPTIGPAMKKGAVHDAASAIQRACSMARQLARSTTQPRGTPTEPLKWYGVAVVVPSEANKAAYAVVVYDDDPISYSNASNETKQYPNGTPKLDGTNTTYSGIKPAGRFPFSRNVMPIKADSATSSAIPSYEFMSPGTAVGWYYQYRTGFVTQNPKTGPSSGVDVGVPAVGTAPTGTPQALGVASLDMKYRVAVAIYKIGLLNAQDVN